MTKTEIVWDPPEKCRGRSKQRQAPCNLPPAFGWADYCRFHSGLTPPQVELARQRINYYETWTSDPTWRKRFVLRQYARAMARYEMRRARKTSPEHVAALVRQREQEKAARAREIAENRRLRAQKKPPYREGQPAAPSPADRPVPVEEFDPWDHDWFG